MKIKDITEETLAALSEVDRDKALTVLAKQLSGVSVSTLQDFQDNWDYKRPYAEFRAEQDRVVLMCVKMELSEFGVVTRAMLGLQPVDPEIELLPEVSAS